VLAFRLVVVRDRTVVKALVVHPPYPDPASNHVSLRFIALHFTFSALLLFLLRRFGCRRGRHCKGFSLLLLLLLLLLCIFRLSLHDAQIHIVRYHLFQPPCLNSLEIYPLDGAILVPNLMLVVVRLVVVDKTVVVGLVLGPPDGNSPTYCVILEPWFLIFLNSTCRLRFRSFLLLGFLLSVIRRSRRPALHFYALTICLTMIAEVKAVINPVNVLPR